MTISREMMAARKRCCAGGMISPTDIRPMCVNWRDNAGWEHPYCGEPEQNRPPGVDLPGCGGPLNDEALNGPAEFCPLGLWADLEPVDSAAIKKVARQNLLADQREMLAPRVKAWMKGLDSDARTTLLENLVECGMLASETAEAIAVDEGLVEP